MKDKITELIKRNKNKVDYLEIRLEESESLFIKFLGKSLDNLNKTSSNGGYIRCCHKGSWGFCSFNSSENLQSHIDEAISQAIILGNEKKDKTILFQLNPITATTEIKLTGKDPRLIPLNTKVDLITHYHSLMNSYSKRVKSASSRYNEEVKKIIFANSERTIIEHGFVDMEARFSVTAQKNGTIQVAQESLGSRKGFEEIENLDKKIKATTKRAIDQLDLKLPKGGVYTIVIDPILTGLFVHEAFGHLSEGDFIYDNPSMKEIMTLGRRFGENFLNVLDGAKISDHRGSFLYDDEGTSTQNTYLIKEGMLVGRLHSRETAGKLNEKPTGNARCLNYRFPPIVRMTNTWIEPQNNSLEDLISDIKLGIWAGNWLGGQTNGEMFTFSSGEARMIRNGKLAESIKDVNLSGNVFQTLKDIEGIGNDMYWDESGGCGKSGQSGLPVGVGGPSIRIRNVLVPGE